MTPETKHDPMEQVVGCSLMLVTMPLQIAFGILRGGYTLATLWRWFVAPTFGVPALSLPLAGGLMLVIWFATMKWPDTPKSNDSAFDTFVKSMGRELGLTVYAALVLLEGYVIHRVWLT